MRETGASGIRSVNPTLFPRRIRRSGASKVSMRPPADSQVRSAAVPTRASAQLREPGLRQGSVSPSRPPGGSPVLGVVQERSQAPSRSSPFRGRPQAFLRKESVPARSPSAPGTDPSPDRTAPAPDSIPRGSSCSCATGPPRRAPGRRAYPWERPAVPSGSPPATARPSEAGPVMTHRKLLRVWD